jgi:Na+/H+ antiporter NhaC
VILRQVPFAATLALKELKNGTLYPRFLFFSIEDQNGALLRNGSLDTMDADGNFRTHWQVPVDRLKIDQYGAHDLTTTVMEITQDNTTLPFMTTLTSSVFVTPGWISLLPPLVTLAVSAALSQVLVALLAGIWVGATIVEQGNPLFGFLRTFDKYWVNAFVDDGHAGVLLFTIVLGGTIGVVQKGGGGHGLALLAKQFMTTSLRMQLSTWLLCLLIFFDDYSCILIIGSSLRQVLSQTGVSREKFAAIIHTIGVCLPSMAPVSSWIGVEIGYVAAQLQALGLKDWDPFMTCLSCLHFRFFPILFIGLIFITIITEKDFGPMVQFEKDAATSPINADGVYTPLDMGPCDSPRSELGALEPDTRKPLRWQNAVLPFVSIIALTFGGMIYDGFSRLDAQDPDGDYSVLDALSNCNSVAALIRASAAGWVIAVVLLLAQKIVTLDEATKAWMEGVKDIIDPTLILVLAWALGTVIGEVNVAPYIASVVGDQIEKAYLPAIACCLCFIVSFATGSAFGTMAIMFPIIAPLSFTISNGDTDNLLQCFGSIMGASVFGNTCSPIADTSILTSLSAHIPLQNHIRSIMPYALLVATLSVVGGALPVGMNLFSPFTAFGVCLGAMLLVVYFCGTRVNSRFRRLSSCSFLSASPPSVYTRAESQSLLSNKNNT